MDDGRSDRGRYVALEGIEGAGKSTVAADLAAAIEATGTTVVSVREPGGTAAGERIRDLLLDPEARLIPWAEALLFAAARSELAAEVVGPALAAGAWVVSDRTVYSSLAYQGGARGLGIDAVRAVNEAGLGGVWPDVVVLLEVDAATGLERQAVADRIGAEGPGFQREVAAAFAALAAEDPGRFLVVDASQPVDAVVTAILDHLGVAP